MIFLRSHWYKKINISLLLSRLICRNVNTYNPYEWRACWELNLDWKWKINPIAASKLFITYFPFGDRTKIKIYATQNHQTYYPNKQNVSEENQVLLVAKSKTLSPPKCSSMNGDTSYTWEHFEYEIIGKEKHNTINILKEKHLQWDISCYMLTWTLFIIIMKDIT